MLRTLSRLLVRISAGGILLAIIAGIPTWLVAAVGWPLPHQRPTFDSLTTTINGHVTDLMVINLIAIAIWLTWAVFTQAVAAELRDAARGIPTRRRLNPMRTAAALLVSSMLLGSVLTATAAASGPSPPRATPVAAVQLTSQANLTSTASLTPAAVGPVTVQVGDTSYVYVVKRGDYLSKIAKEWLGDANRWPEICAMNKHRHFPKIGGTLHDCNLIYPGWDLRLPTDAHPPQHAKPAASTRPVKPHAPTPAPAVTSHPPASASPSTDPNTTATPSAQTTPSAPATQSVQVAPSTPVSAVNPVRPPHSEPSLTGAPSSTSSTTTSPATAPTPTSPTSTTASADHDGVHISPANWLPWAIAAAIASATALVWMQRRRRYTGEPDADPPTQLPPPVEAIRTAVTRNPNPATPTEDTNNPLPEIAPLPPGGLGDGAPAAARATLVAVLASGTPHHPHARGEIVIDAATLTTLIGSDAVTLGPWPRLHVTDDTDAALTLIETRLLHRSRILDEHALTDLDTLHTQAPDEEALPPITLITDTPPPGARMRAKVALAIGGDLRVSALLLGEWEHGPTIDISADGHTRLVSGQPTGPIPPRLPILEPDTTVQILTTLREAQTGQPSTHTPPTAVVPLHTSRTGDTATIPPVTANSPNPGKARLRVLGPPRIDDITTPGRPLRAKALELAVFLACHPDGLATRDIGEYLEPDARISQADQRVHTNASNLRHVLARAGTTEAKNSYVIKTAGRYRLDPATVEVDIWTLRDLLRAATIATGQRRRDLLTTACDLATAPLAEGQDYEWLPPHRETIRRWSTEAHLLLADDLLPDNPQTASDLLNKAIDLDRYNEALYRKAMHARHALGDTDGIRTLLRALTKALADLDAEPEEETLTLATQLRTSLEHR